MNSQTTKKVTVALGVATMAAATGSVAVQAGPALQTLNNMTNTAEFSINNTYGQSFSVDGIVNASLLPFSNTGALTVAGFTAGSALITTGFAGGNQVGGFIPVSSMSVQIEAVTNAVPIQLNATNMEAVTLLAAGTSTVTMGASISSTLFGPSTVKASSSFTNQIINDLSAF